MLKGGAAKPLIVLLAGGLILLISFGTRQSYSVFLKPMTGDLGWSREAFALALGIAQLMWGVAQPVAGAMAVRYGASKVAAVGALVSALGMLASAHVTSPGMFQLTAGVIVGTFGAGIGFATILAAVAQSFPPENRTVVMGISTSLASMGQFIFVPLGQEFIIAYGWQTALTIIASCGFAGVALAGALPGKADAWSGHHQSWGEATREALAHRGFLYISAAYFVCGFHVAFIGSHLPAYLSDQGLDPRIGAWAIAMIGAGNIIGSTLSGILGSRFRKRNVLGLIYFGRALVIIAFVMTPTTVASTMAFAVAMGLLWLSTVPLTTGIVGQVFGMQHFAMLNGIAFMMHQIGAIIGVWLAGRLFDMTGSYAIAWWISIGLALMAAAFCFPADDRAITRQPAPAMR